MAQTKEIARFAGRLAGEGRESACTVSALKVMLPGAGVSAIARFTITDTAEALPAGNYELSVNGEKHALRHFNGQWLAAAI